MNKKRVDKWIPVAKIALKECNIADNNNKIDSEFRSQISAFGASIITSSFLAAVAFYSNKGNSDVNRHNLICALHYITSGNNENTNTAAEIFEDLCQKNTSELKIKQSEYIDASIALKLAMNCFDLGKGNTPKEAANAES